MQQPRSHPSPQRNMAQPSKISLIYTETRATVADTGHKSRNFYSVRLNNYVCEILMNKRGYIERAAMKCGYNSCEKWV